MAGKERPQKDSSPIYISVFLAPVPLLFFPLLFIFPIVNILPLPMAIKISIIPLVAILPLTVCILVAFLTYRSRWKALTKEDRLWFIKQTGFLILAFAVTLPIIPFLVFQVIAGGADNWNFAAGILGLGLSIISIPAVVSLGTFAANNLLEDGPDPYFKPLSILIAVWIVQSMTFLIPIVKETSTMFMNQKGINEFIVASPDNQHCAIGASKGRIIVQSIKPPYRSQKVLLFDKKDSCPDSIWEMTYSPDGSVLVISFMSRRTFVLDSMTLKELKRIDDASKITFFPHSPKFLYLSNHGYSLNEMDYCNWDSRIVIDFLAEGHVERSGAPGISNDERTCYLYPYQTLKLYQYDLVEGKYIGEKAYHTNFPNECFMEDANLPFFQREYVIPFPDGTILELRSNVMLGRPPGYPAKVIPVYETNIFMYAEDNEYRVSDWATKKTSVVSSNMVAGTQPIHSITITPDGKHILRLEKGKGDLIVEDVPQ